MPSHPNEKYTADEMAKTLLDCRGFVTTTAHRLGCSLQTVRNYIKRYAACRAAVDEARESMKDFAESKLMTEIDGGNITAIIFYLKTQAKDRGYIERQEITGGNGAPVLLQVEYINADPSLFSEGENQ